MLHHSERGWRHAVHLEDLFGGDALESLSESSEGIQGFVPRWRVTLCDVSHTSDEELRARFESAYIRVVLASLRDARRLPRGGVDRQAIERWLERVREWLEPLLADQYPRVLPGRGGRCARALARYLVHDARLVSRSEDRA